MSECFKLKSFVTIESTDVESTLTAKKGANKHTIRFWLEVKVRLDSGHYETCNRLNVKQLKSDLTMKWMLKRISLLSPPLRLK